MWDELAFNLQNQPSEEETARQDAKMQAEINEKLDKIYGEDIG